MCHDPFYVHSSTKRGRMSHLIWSFWLCLMDPPLLSVKLYLHRFSLRLHLLYKELVKPVKLTTILSLSNPSVLIHQ